MQCVCDWSWEKMIRVRLWTSLENCDWVSSAQRLETTAVSRGSKNTNRTFERSVYNPARISMTPDTAWILCVGWDINFSVKLAFCVVVTACKVCTSLESAYVIIYEWMSTFLLKCGRIRQLIIIFWLYFSDEKRVILYEWK